MAGAFELARLLPRSGRNAGRIAPEFRLQGTDGRWVILRSLRGKVVFLNVWATWCGACRSEMPAMNRLYEHLRSNSDFEMFAISIDDQPGDRVRAFIQKGGYAFPVLLDPENRIATAYEVGGIPHTFIVDREGRIAWDVVGAPNWSDPSIRAAIEKML
ncbi:MAG: TlpA family protein disulfide reductase [Candidatus Binataceae bacterium]